MSQRKKINCIKCGKEQSTYSTNREHCHVCKPKCREIHTFENLLEQRAKQAKAEANA